MIDWSKAPEWANWHAIDSDGGGYWYEVKPILHRNQREWMYKSNTDQYKGSKDYSDFGDWRETLRERPPKKTLMKYNHYHKPTSGAYLVDLEWVLNVWGVQCEHVRSAIGALLGADHQGAKPTNGAETVDVYWVLNAWGVQCHATGHAIKKLLNAGQRGVKPTRQDLNEAIDSIKRAIELLEDRND